MQQDDRDGHFGVRWMAGTDKRLIADAAKRAKMTTGEWLGQAARAAVARERETMEPGGGEILPPPSGARIDGFGLQGMTAIEQALAIMERVIRLQGMTADHRHRLAAIMAAFDAAADLEPRPAGPARPRLSNGRFTTPD